MNGLSDDVFMLLSSNALHVVHSIATGMVGVMAAQFHLQALVEDFGIRLEELEIIPGLVLADIRLQSIGEPQRVFIAYPQRA